MIHDIPASKQLIEAFYRKQAPILCLKDVPDNMVSSYGIVSPIFLKAELTR